MRHFSPSEAAKFIGIHEGYLRQLVADRSTDLNPMVEVYYSVENIDELRNLLDQGAKGSRRYVPHRSDQETLQVICVMNFKGGSGKTTTSAHLAQYLALRGYRVLAINFRSSG